MVVGKSSAFKNSPHVVYRVFPYLQGVFSLLASFFPNWCFFLSLWVSSHVFSSSLTSFPLPLTHANAPEYIRAPMLLLFFLICILFCLFGCLFFFCWVCFVWHFYILIQNMLSSVYLKLLKHSKWSLWEVGGVQGMRPKAAGHGLYLAHLPLPIKTTFTGLILPIPGSEQLPTVA